MSCPRSTARFGEVARPEGADDAEHVPGARGAEEQRSGAQGGDLNQANKRCQLVVVTRTNFVHVIVTLDLFSV